MGETVTILSNGEDVQGYLARPESGGGPAVVLIQEWWGLVPHILEVADRLAGEGFVVLAPDLYRGVRTTDPDEAEKRMMALDLDHAAKTIAGAADYLRDLDEVTGDGIGCIGFCMGGALALWSGALSEDVVAIAPFYPAMPWEDLRPDWSAYGGKHVVIHLAEGDGGSAAPKLQDAKAGLEAAGATVTLHDYAGTHHAFFNDHRPEVHDPEAAALAWQRTVQFLHERLG